jgi:very-short-patch-repair endonuclease
MTVVEVLTRMGGVGDAHTVVAFTSRRKVQAALDSGQIVRDAPGRYALPGAQQARREAARLSAVVTGLSAAAHYGWELKVQPDLPTLTVPRNRNVSAARRAGVDLRWRRIPPNDVWDGVLRPGPTVIDCARTRPFDEALAVADSALRHGDVSKPLLGRLAEQVSTTGRAECLRVAREASPLAANPFESVLRAIALDVPGLELQPQVVISESGFTGRPDLVDQVRRLVVEAESFEFHGRRRALRRDCERYNALVLRGWTVIRFAWEHVMLQPEYVTACLHQLAALERAPGRAASPARGRIPA